MVVVRRPWNWRRALSHDMVLQLYDFAFNGMPVLFSKLLEFAEQKPTAGQHFPRSLVGLASRILHPLQTINGAQLIFVVLGHSCMLAPKSYLMVSVLSFR